MNKLIWYARQMLPLHYRTRYVENGQKHFVVWQMWLGQCFAVDDVEVK